MKKIAAKIVADSISPQGHRITSFILTYPRFIHSELMTHRVFSRNSASSRAIPFEKMVKMVEEYPFIPIAWQFDHKGMQGNEYVTEESDYGGIEARNQSWLQARDFAIQQARDLNSMDTTKQLCNRLLEPFMWHTTLVTATELSNFFELRCPKYYGKFKSWKDASNKGGATYETPFEFRINDSQSEIHIQALAEAMWDAMNESTPKELKSGEWHIPFGDNIEPEGIIDLHYKLNNIPRDNAIIVHSTDYKVKIATARCARLSYMTFDREIDYEKDISLHDQLLKSGHFSPFEHCARAMSDFEYNDAFDKQENGKLSLGWCNNFRGWVQYRYLVENK